MPLRTKFKNLKQLKLKDTDISLVILKEYKRNKESQYSLSYVQIDRKLENRLRDIMIKKIDIAKTFEAYSYDCPEPEEDEIRAINYESTDFYRIYQKLEELNPEEDVICSVEELLKAKAYLIIVREKGSMKVVGFKTLPENWKMKLNKGLIPLLFKENRFEDLENDNVFSISSQVDFIYYDEVIFILSKKGFESGLNFRDGMIAKAQELYNEIKQLDIFINMDLLTNKVGNNQRYLRKIATIKNLGYYKDAKYLQRLHQINVTRNWGLQFQNRQIVITEENLETILTVLQNKRLHSELTDETFDVDSAKKIELQNILN